MEGAWNENITLIGSLYRTSNMYEKILDRQTIIMAYKSTLLTHSLVEGRIETALVIVLRANST